MLEDLSCNGPVLKDSSYPLVTSYDIPKGMRWLYSNPHACSNLKLTTWGHEIKPEGIRPQQANTLQEFPMQRTVKQNFYKIV